MLNGYFRKMYWHSMVVHTRLNAMTLLFFIIGILAVAGIAAALVVTGRDGYRRRASH